MVKYYNSNALYDYITEEEIENFTFTSGNLWQLVYGDANCEPKLLAVVSGVQNDDLESATTVAENEACRLLSIISNSKDVPLIFIRFIIDASEVSQVLIFEHGEERYEIIGMNELKQRFREAGLEVTNSSTTKYLNDATSSAYHKWQRNNLGRNITVADFDLWRLDEEKKPLEVHELKRSYYSLDRWEPFKDDYSNFSLLDNTLKGLDIDFKIVYNVRTKNPWKDDISRLKIFDVDFNKHPEIEFNETIDLEDFLE